MKVPAKRTIGDLNPCNAVPPIWKPEWEVQTEDPDQTYIKATKHIFEELELNDPNDWMTKEDIQETKKLVQKFRVIFSKNDLDLEKTDKFKCKIKVTDPAPLMERYRRI